MEFRDYLVEEVGKEGHNTSFLEKQLVFKNEVLQTIYQSSEFNPSYWEFDRKLRLVCSTLSDVNFYVHDDVEIINTILIGNEVIYSFGDYKKIVDPAAREKYKEENYAFRRYVEGKLPSLMPEFRAIKKVLIKPRYRVKAISRIIQ